MLSTCMLKCITQLVYAMMVMEFLNFMLVAIWVFMIKMVDLQFIMGMLVMISNYLMKWRWVIICEFLTKVVVSCLGLGGVVVFVGSFTIANLNW